MHADAVGAWSIRRHMDIIPELGLDPQRAFSESSEERVEPPPIDAAERVVHQVDLPDPSTQAQRGRRPRHLLPAPAPCIVAMPGVYRSDEIVLSVITDKCDNKIYILNLMKKESDSYL